MSISYNKLWKLLIDKNLKKTDLITDAHISTSALSKMSKNQYVSLLVIEKVCVYLDCKIEDIITILND